MSETKKKQSDVGAFSEEELEKAFQQISDEAEEILKAESGDGIEEEILDDDSSKEEDLKKAEDGDDDDDEEELDAEEIEAAADADDDDDANEDEEEDLKKAKDGDDDEDDKEEEEEGNDDDDDDDEEEKKKKIKSMKKKKVEKSNKDDLSFSKNPKIQKALEVSDFLKELVGDIEKAESKRMKAVVDLGTIVKSLSSRLTNLTEKFETEPRQPKSKIKKSEIADKFEKGHEEELGEGGEKVLHIQKDYSRIVQILDEKTFVGGNMNPEFAKALTSLESTKSLPRAIVEKLYAEDKIRIVA